MTGELRIRLAREHELIAAGRLVRRAYETAYRLEPEYLEEIGDAVGRSRSAQVWVAVDAGSGELLGSITTPFPGERLQNDTAIGEMDLRLLGVAPAARGRGVGERLMQHCLELARERGAQRVVLHTASQMAPAQRLYERMGFARIPEREYEFTAAGERRLLMAYGIAVRSGEFAECSESA